MLTNDLLWDEVDTRYGRRWKCLNDYFGFSGCDLFKNSVPPFQEQHRDLLNVIAENCVYMCRELLFSLEPIDNLLKNAERYGAISDYTDLTRSLMETNLRQALCDQLILSFAYKFCCDNLETKKLRWYSDTVYDLQFPVNGSPLRGERTIVSKEKADYYKGLSRKYDAFFRDIADLLFDEDQLTFKERLQAKHDKEHISPVESWFLIFLVSERIRYRTLWLRSKKDKYTSLMDLVSRTGLVTTILPTCGWGDKSSKELPNKLVSMCDSGNTFVGIPVSKSNSDSFKIPSQTYKLVIGNETVNISDKLQMAFNNFLVEKYFHLHTLVETENIFSKYPIDEPRGASIRDSVFKIAELQAPLLQAAIISFVGENHEVSMHNDLIKRYVDRWNRFALPILGDLFVWSVWEVLKQPTDVSTAINNWITPKHTYERLNKIRLFKTKTDRVKNKNPRFYNEIIDNVFSKYMNASQTSLVCQCQCASANVPVRIYQFKFYLGVSTL